MRPIQSQKPLFYAHFAPIYIVFCIKDAQKIEPSMGIGNFFGMLPDEMSASRLYGLELDSITGRIAKQLYTNADITVDGFETTDRRDFFDLAIGNVPFGRYQVNDRLYNKQGFSIENRISSMNKSQREKLAELLDELEKYPPIAENQGGTHDY